MFFLLNPFVGEIILLTVWDPVWLEIGFSILFYRL